MREGLVDRAARAQAEFELLTGTPALSKVNRIEYNVMNGSTEKKTNTLSVENAGFLIRRIEESTGGPELASGGN